MGCVPQFLVKSLLLVVICAAGCAPQPANVRPVRRANGQVRPITPDKNRIRVACIGDSITFGAGLEEPSTQSYPAQLQKRLGVKYQVANFGHNGATASHGTDKPYTSLPEFQDALDFQPNIVIVLLGTNDAAPKNWPRVKDQFEADYKALIRQFAALPTKPRIIVCMPPPAPGNQREPTLGEEVAPLIHRISKAARVKSIDLRHIFLHEEGLFSDGLHLGAKGTSKVAEALAGHLLNTNTPKSVESSR